MATLNPYSNWITKPATWVSTSTFTVANTLENQEMFKAGRPLRYKVNSVATDRFGYVASYVTGTVTIGGYPLTASIQEMNVGHLGLMRQETIVINGGFSAVTSNQLILDYVSSYFRWKLAKAHIVKVDMINVTAETGATKPVLNVKNVTSGGNNVLSTGTTLTASATWYSSGILIETANGTYNDVNYNDIIELAYTTQGTNGTALDLTVVINFVLE